MKRIWIPQAIAGVMLLWALNPGNPYGYYILLRWVCCAAFTYLALKAFAQGKEGGIWVLGITAIVYNPIVRIHLTREIWSVVNVATMVLAGWSIFVLKSTSGEIETGAKTTPGCHQDASKQTKQEKEVPTTVEHQKYRVVGTGPRHHCST